MAAWLGTRRTTVVPELRERRLTSNPVGNPVTSAVISPDGKYLAYSDLNNRIHLKLIATGETPTIPQTEGWAATSWFPNSTKLLANGRNQRGLPVHLVNHLSTMADLHRKHSATFTVSAKKA